MVLIKGTEYYPCRYKDERKLQILLSKKVPLKPETIHLISNNIQDITFTNSYESAYCEYISV